MTALNLWKIIVGTNGVNMIKENYTHFLRTFINELSCKSHHSKEAACRSLQELVMEEDV
jgi:hypothetical protein